MAAKQKTDWVAFFVWLGSFAFCLLFWYALLSVAFGGE